jgi:probable addiction module antidote protein
VPKKTQPYDTWQADRLSHPDAASAFLNAARADSLEMFLLALRKVAQAHQMARVAKEANIQRETLYRALSGDGNPTIVTLSSVLDVLGLDFILSPKKKPTVPDPRTEQKGPRLSVLVESPPKNHIGIVNIADYKAGIGQNDRELVRQRDLGGSGFAFGVGSLGSAGTLLPQKSERQQQSMEMDYVNGNAKRA